MSSFFHSYEENSKNSQVDESKITPITEKLNNTSINCSANIIDKYSNQNKGFDEMLSNDGVEKSIKSFAKLERVHPNVIHLERPKVIFQRFKDENKNKNYVEKEQVEGRYRSIKRFKEIRRSTI